MLKLLDDLRNAYGVDIPVRAAAKWRKAYAEHGTNVTVARLTDNSFLHTPRGFVDHREHATALNLVLRDRGTARARWEQRVHGFVHSAFLPLFVVCVKPFLSLPAKPAGTEAGVLE